jgi:shikimate kinase
MDQQHSHKNDHNSADTAGALPKLGKSIVLVGLMGSGKSTIGRRLAAALNMPFHDADAEIETAAGLTITEIFDRYGEAHFRDGERRVIHRLMSGPPKILATGGGAFINADTRALLLSQAICIWLDTDINTLAERVARRDTRPLLRGKDPVAVLTELAAIRNPIYAEAHIRVSSTRSPHERTVDQILKELSEWLG